VFTTKGKENHGLTSAELLTHFPHHPVVGEKDFVQEIIGKTEKEELNHQTLQSSTTNFP